MKMSVCFYKLHNSSFVPCPYLKDLKAGDVEDSQEGGSLAFGLVQGLVDSAQDPAEQSLKHSFSQGFNSKVSLTNTHKEKISI